VGNTKCVRGFLKNNFEYCGCHISSRTVRIVNSEEDSDLGNKTLPCVSGVCYCEVLRLFPHPVKIARAIEIISLSSCHISFTSILILFSYVGLCL
jgi:hypothetical protein